MAMIPSAFFSKFGEDLYDLAKEEVEMLFAVPGEIKKLQNNLRRISKVLIDAEKKSIDDEVIDDWLKELKDFMYDADDILDLCRIKADKRSEGSSSTSSVRFSIPFLSGIQKLPDDHEIGTKIKKLNQKLEEIWRWRSAFNLELTSLDKKQVTSQISRKTSSVGEIDIVGSEIEENTQSLVDSLIKNDKRRKIVVSVIVGPGGIGKTTLAKKIYNDERIQEEFSEKRWVCVSQEFDEIKLLKEILDGDKNDRAGDWSKSSLEPKVEKSFRGKKLFLVLDDVWTEKVWSDLLCNTLQSCAAGSRILVTTRNEKIAKQIRAVNTHHVNKLSLEDGWLLLCKKVVLTEEEGEIQHLEDIGMEIVKKCDGLPLAIKAVAGVLCTKEKTRRAWKGVLESNVVGVMGALYLSYEDLPSYLKQCFVYCSLFPEDHFIGMDEITQLWIAEGFVKAEGSLTMEETAKECYRELIMRNLLQANFRMHDLFHCLARYMARDESLVLMNMRKVGGSNGPMKLRRVFVPNYKITDNEMTEILDVLVKHDSLRTLLWRWSLTSETRMDVIFVKLSRLRVLDMSFSEIQSLPDSLGNLIHLRYLNISYTRISVIPESIGNLRNLQTLHISLIKISMLPESIGNLRNLRFLAFPHLSRLPNSIANLHNVRTLDLEGTRVAGIPAGLGRIQHLHTLREFNPPSNRAEGWCTIEELRSLSCLTDLSIARLERISSSSEARAAELRNKPELSMLKLRCTRDLQPSEDEMRRIKEVFEELHPPPCLEEVEIIDYFGREFPKWMAEASPSASILFPDLRRLSLLHCGYCERLPPCGVFPNLEHLAIWDAAPVIEEWHWDKGTQAMPCLKSLCLHDCPKLISLPEGLLLHTTPLTKLEILFADSLTTIGNLRSLKELIITVAPSLEKVSDLPMLTILQVAYCPALRVVENLQSLKRMRLINYDMKSLPSYLLQGVQRGTKKRKRVEIAHLEKLEIMCSDELARLICHRASSEWPKIQDIQQVHVHSQDRPVLFYSKSPFSFTTEL